MAEPSLTTDRALEHNATCKVLVRGSGRSVSMSWRSRSVTLLAAAVAIFGILADLVGNYLAVRFVWPLALLYALLAVVMALFHALLARSSQQSSAESASSKVDNDDAQLTASSTPTANSQINTSINKPVNVINITTAHPLQNVTRGPTANCHRYIGRPRLRAAQAASKQFDRCTNTHVNTDVHVYPDCDVGNIDIAVRADNKASSHPWAIEVNSACGLCRSL